MCLGLQPGIGGVLICRYKVDSCSIRSSHFWRHCVPCSAIAWIDVTVGAAVTAVCLLSETSSSACTWEPASVGSAYGAAGSVVVLLVWIYYSAQVFFLGAEFTQVYAWELIPSYAPASPYLGQLGSARQETGTCDGCWCWNARIG